MNTHLLVEKETTAAIIGSFFEVYNRLGFGFLENVYSLALERELQERGHAVNRELAVTVSYREKPLTTVRLDMVVDEKVVVEIKSSAVFPPFARRQTLNYLRASGLEVGLVLHFGPAAKFYRIVQSHRQPRGQVSEGDLAGSE